MDLKAYLRSAQAYVEAQGYRCAYIALYGSQNYGLALNTPDYQSDIDVKCAVMPTLSQLVREEFAQPATLDWRGGQIEIKDARRFVGVCLKMNPAYLETLITPHYLAPCAAFEQLRACVPSLLQQHSAEFLGACKGLAMTKKKNFCHPFPAAMEKIRRWGYDGKQAHHMYRLLLIMRQFEKEGIYVLAAPETEKGFLLALKRYEIPLSHALQLADGWADEAEAICRRRESKAERQDTVGAQMREMVNMAVETHIRRQIVSEENIKGI